MPAKKPIYLNQRRVNSTALTIREAEALAEFADEGLAGLQGEDLSGYPEGTAASIKAAERACEKLRKARRQALEDALKRVESRRKPRRGAGRSRTFPGA